MIDNGEKKNEMGLLSKTSPPSMQISIQINHKLSEPGDHLINQHRMLHNVNSTLGVCVNQLLTKIEAEHESADSHEAVILGKIDNLVSQIESDNHDEERLKISSFPYRSASWSSQLDSIKEQPNEDIDTQLEDNSEDINRRMLTRSMLMKFDKNSEEVRLDENHIRESDDLTTVRSSQLFGSDLLLDSDNERPSSSCLEEIDESVNAEDDNQSVLTDITDMTTNELVENRTAVVSGYSKSTDGVVYYEISVECSVLGPLSAYKVRRRYKEFKKLHAELSKIMDQENNSVLGEIFSPRSQKANSQDFEPLLPSLPDSGGLWSYLKPHDSALLDCRRDRFDKIINTAQEHYKARTSSAMMEFLGKPPNCTVGGASAYVSLQMYAAPSLRLSIEYKERKKKAKAISERRSAPPKSCPSELNRMVSNCLSKAIGTIPPKSCPHINFIRSQK